MSGHVQVLLWCSEMSWWLGGDPLSFLLSDILLVTQQSGCAFNTFQLKMQPMTRALLQLLFMSLKFPCSFSEWLNSECLLAALYWQHLSPPDLQSNSQTPTSLDQRGQRWCQYEGRRWEWSPTGPPLWRQRSNAGEPSPQKPPVSPPWIQQGSPSTSSHMVTRPSWCWFTPLRVGQFCGLRILGFPAVRITAKHSLN